MSRQITPYRCPNCESKDYELTPTTRHNYRCNNCGEKFDKRKDMRNEDPDYWLKP